MSGYLDTDIEPVSPASVDARWVESRSKFSTS